MTLTTSTRPDSPPEPPADTESRLGAIERILRAVRLDPRRADELAPERKRRQPPPETRAEAALRLGCTEVEVTAICSGLACKPAEVLTLTATPDGTVVTMPGPVLMVHRGPDRPDGAGRTGWLRVPHPDPAIEAARERNTQTPAFVAPEGEQ